MKESLRYYGISKLLPCLKQGGPEGGDARVVNVSSRLLDRVNNTDLFQSQQRLQFLKCVRVVKTGAHSFIIRERQTVREGIQLAIGGAAPRVS